MASKKKKLVPPPEIAEPERLGKSDQRLGAILNEEIISKQYDKATKKLDAWEKKTFKGSGALGEIPGWFPQNDVIRLSVVREWLARRWDEETRKFVKRYSLKDIMEMMVAFRKHKETNMPLTHYHSKSKTRNIAKPTLVPFPKEAYGPVSVVCHYDDTISAGPDEGLKKMVGEQAAKQISAGSKVIRGGQNANIKTYGTKADREKQHETWRKEAVRLHQEHPKWPWYKIAEDVGNRFGKNERTIRKHVINVCK